MNSSLLLAIVGGVFILISVLVGIVAVAEQRKPTIRSKPTDTGPIDGPDVDADPIRGKKLGIIGTTPISITNAPAPSPTPSDGLWTPETLVKIALGIFVIGGAALWALIAQQSTEVESSTYSFYDARRICDADFSAPRVAPANGVIVAQLTVSRCVPTLDARRDALVDPPAAIAPVLTVGTVPVPAPSPKAGTPVVAIALQPASSVSGAVGPRIIEKYHVGADEPMVESEHVWRWLVASDNADQSIFVTFRSGGRIYVSPTLVLHAAAVTPWIASATSTFAPLGVALLGIISTMYQLLKGPATK